MNYEDFIKKGINHLSGGNADKAIQLLNSNQGSRSGCLSLVFTHAKTECLLSWFKNKDLAAAKRWAYVAAKVRRMMFQMTPWSSFPAYEHLFALISDHLDAIAWYSNHRVPFFVEDDLRGNESTNKDDPATITFHSYQTSLALRREWEELHRRCALILSHPSETEWKDLLVDHRFFLALAEGDKRGMKAALDELAGPVLAPRRNFDFAFGLTENLIATHATTYAKIAWCNGYEIDVDSPWVPRQWLRIAPLPAYVDPWPFLAEFDFWTHFEGDYESWSPKRL